MGVTIQRKTDCGIFTWNVTRHCLSQGEMLEAARLLDCINSAAYLPEAFAPEIAFRETGSATGVSNASHVEDVPDARPLSAATEALMEFGDEDAPIESLNFDKPDAQA